MMIDNTNNHCAIQIQNALKMVILSHIIDSRQAQLLFTSPHEHGAIITRDQ